MPWASDDQDTAPPEPNTPAQEAGGWASEKLPPTSEPTVGGWASEQPPQAEGPMPGFFRALGQGAIAGVGEAQQSAQALRGEQPQPEKEISPAAQPLQWSDIPSGDIFPKIGYQLGRGMPTVGAGVAGGLAGTAIAGPGGALVGGTAGAAVGAAFQSVGPLFAEELKKSPSDPDGAWGRALHQAEISGAFSGAGWALFPVRFFQGPLKQFAFQALGVQPAVGMAEQATQNVAAGRPATENLGQAYAQSAVGTAIPLAGHETIRALSPKNVPDIQPPSAGPMPQGPTQTGQPMTRDIHDVIAASPVTPSDNTLAGRATSWWKRTFQPEETGRMAISAYPDFRQYVSGLAQARDSIYHDASPAHYLFNKYYANDIDGAIDFMSHAAGEPTSPGYTVPQELQKYLPEFRQLMDMVETSDKDIGFDYGHRDDYFPRQYKDPDRAVQAAAQFMLARKNMQRPGFEKARTLEFLRDGRAMGLELVSNNPADLIANRLVASAEASERVNLLRRLNESNLSGRLENEGQKAAAVSGGWIPVKDPTGAEWAIHPDLKPMWDNVIAAKGLWGSPDVAGNLFRGWMKTKNAYVPIKLALSGFHPLHVAHINIVNGFARGWQELKAGNLPGMFSNALRGISSIFTEAIPGLKTQGKAAREAWLTPEWKQTPEQKQTVQIMKDGGFSPQLAEQLRTYDSRTFWDNWQKGNYFRALPYGARQAFISTLQKPIFEHWIPSLKTAAYLNEAQGLLSRRPDLMNNDTARKAALTTIGKSIDNRYGEMFYHGLFWNKAVKDIGIGSFLSLGWNLGFVREFGGGVLEPYLRSVVDSNNPTRQAIQLAKNKTAFAIAYMSTAMAINAAMTYYMTGQPPEGMDYFLPRIGGTNPDNSPRRVTNMFYTREVPMLTKHVEEQQSVLGGVKSMLWNKMMLQPASELMNNKDYYGYNIWDENAPFYKRAQQLTSYILSDQFNPITIAGAKRSLQASGKWNENDSPATKLEKIMTNRESLMSLAGFGPAPGYAAKTPMQNRIAHEFERYVAPQERPQLMREEMERRRDAYMRLDAAKKSGDSEKAAAAARDLQQYGGVKKKDAPDIYMFGRLPYTIQVGLLKNMERNDFKKYFPKSNKNAKADPDVRALVQRYYQ